MPARARCRRSRRRAAPARRTRASPRRARPRAAPPPSASSSSSLMEVSNHLHTSTCQANRATAAATRSRSASVSREWNGSASARSKAASAPGNGPWSRYASGGAARTCRSAPRSPPPAARRAPRRGGRGGRRMPASRACRPRPRRDVDEPREPLRVARRDALPRREQLVEPLELRDAERAEDVREAVVDAGSAMSSPLGVEPVVAQTADRGRELGVVVVTAPPSPVVTILRGWNERQPGAPSPPHGMPRQRAPSAPAASSSSSDLRRHRGLELLPVERAGRTGGRRSRPACAA